MKEVTYEEWQKNPTPRMMWVWNSKVEDKEKAKVIHILSNGVCVYPILTITDIDDDYETYKHCAEIEEPKTRRMTNKELSLWLRENPTREYKYQTSDYICSTFEYREYVQDKEVTDDILIRENGSEWRVPLVEVEE